MSWAKIASSNKDKIQEKIKKEAIIKEEKKYDPYSILNFKEVEEEFEFKYLDKMTDISIEFRDFIYRNYLPFMDKNVFVNYTLYDFIKNNSVEYENTIRMVENYNQELIDDYNKEQEELEKELEEEDYISD